MHFQINEWCRIIFRALGSYIGLLSRNKQHLMQRVLLLKKMKKWRWKCITLQQRMRITSKQHYHHSEGHSGLCILGLQGGKGNPISSIICTQKGNWVCDNYVTCQRCVSYWWTLWHRVRDSVSLICGSPVDEAEPGDVALILGWGWVCGSPGTGDEGCGSPGQKWGSAGAGDEEWGSPGDGDEGWWVRVSCGWGWGVRLSWGWGGGVRHLVHNFKRRKWPIWSALLGAGAFGSYIHIELQSTLCPSGAFKTSKFFRLKSWAISWGSPGEQGCDSHVAGTERCGSPEAMGCGSHGAENQECEESADSPQGC